MASEAGPQSRSYTLFLLAQRRVAGVSSFPLPLVDPAFGRGRKRTDLTAWRRRLALFDAAYRQPATDGYHVVYAGRDYDMDSLGSWARKNVRRGLRCCTVSQIPFERYIEEGWALRLDTLARQRRRVPETRDDWRRKNSAATGLEGFEVWAAEVKHRLAATLLTFQMDGWGYMLYQQCHRDYLREHANNALGFEVTQNLIRRPNVQGIFYGMRSLDAPASVDEFKLRMGYEAKPVRQRVVFHPGLAPLVNRFTHRIAKSLAAVTPASRLMAKAEGLLRISLAEKRLSGPAVPACPESQPVNHK
jgi:hypothetical protein